MVRSSANNLSLAPLPRSKAERFARVPIAPPYPHPFRRFWQQPSKSCEYLKLLLKR
jgi:hypothetical protein